MMRSNLFYDQVWAATYAAAVVDSVKKQLDGTREDNPGRLDFALAGIDDGYAILTANAAVERIREFDSWSEEKQRAYLDPMWEREQRKKGEQQ